MSQITPPLSLLAHPYCVIRPLMNGLTELRHAGRVAGAALVWSMAVARHQACAELVNARPGGLSLLVILPPGHEVASDPDVMHLVHHSRPHGILPFHSTPSAHDLAEVLRRPPVDLAADVMDYLAWRGLGINRDTAHVVRRIIDLSAELRSVSAVSRSMYLSRRALGRHLTRHGLPVPSHWLQIGRLLRVALKLQNSSATVSSVALDLGYPDGFSVSNQMERLTGHRPTEARTRLGWEWLLEAWLNREAEQGTLSPSLSRAMQVNLRTDGRASPAVVRQKASPQAPTRRQREGLVELRDGSSTQRLPPSPGSSP